MAGESGRHDQQNAPCPPTRRVPQGPASPGSPSSPGSPGPPYFRPIGRPPLPLRAQPKLASASPASPPAPAGPAGRGAEQSRPPLLAPSAPESAPAAFLYSPGADLLIQTTIRLAAPQIPAPHLQPAQSASARLVPGSRSRGVGSRGEAAARAAASVSFAPHAAPRLAGGKAKRAAGCGLHPRRRGTARRRAGKHRRRVPVAVWCPGLIVSQLWLCFTCQKPLSSPLFFLSTPPHF